MTERPSQRPRNIVPLFPLPDAILFPGQLLPLKIFEPRYREMVEDLLDRTGDLVIGTVLGADQKLLAQVAPVQPIAGLGRLQGYERIGNGRFLIVVVGTHRVKVFPTASSSSYPLTEIERLPSGARDSLEDPGTSRVLTEAIRARGRKLRTTGRLDPFQLADLLLLFTPMPHAERYRLFATLPPEQRVLAILDAHRRSV